MKYIKKINEAFFLNPIDLKEIMRTEYLSICKDTDSISKYEVSKIKNFISNNYVDYVFNPYYHLKVKLELNKLFIRLTKEELTYAKKYSTFKTKPVKKEVLSISIIKNDDYYYIYNNNKFYKCDQLKELLIILKELMNTNKDIIKKTT